MILIGIRNTDKGLSLPGGIRGHRDEARAGGEVIPPG